MTAQHDIAAAAAATASDVLRDASSSSQNGCHIPSKNYSASSEDEPRRPLLSELFSENIAAKIYRTASTLAGHLPDAFPEYVPQTGSDAGRYQLREAEFWTCGFFPGTMYALLERTIRFPEAFSGFLGLDDGGDSGNQQRNQQQEQQEQRISLHEFKTSLQRLCVLWSSPLYARASDTSTHDIGFIILPALGRRYRLSSLLSSPSTTPDADADAEKTALGSTIITAALSLASRFIPSAGVIRSWDTLRQRDREVTDPETDAIIIIDSMCNLDLLYYAAELLEGRGMRKNRVKEMKGEGKERKGGSGGDGDEDLHLATRRRFVATQHATRLLDTHLRPETPPPPPSSSSSSSPSRPDTTTAPAQAPSQANTPWYSTSHVAILDPTTGDLKQRLTHQGYSDTSTWARGQGWAILGYAQTFMWTRDEKFLRASLGCAEFFLSRLGEGWLVDDGGDEDPYPVPPWDFDAPPEKEEEEEEEWDTKVVPRDSSAGMIAANGMLLLSKGLSGLSSPQREQYPPNLAGRMRDEAIKVARGVITGAVEDRAEFVRDGPGEEMGKEIKVADTEEGKRFDGILKWGTANWNRGARKRYKDHGLVYGDYYFVEFGNRLLDMGLV